MEPFRDCEVYSVMSSTAARRLLVTEIREAVSSGRLTEPFNALMVKAVCPGWADRTYHTFLPKHADGNTLGEKEHFVRVRPGLYRLKRPPQFDST